MGTKATIGGKTIIGGASWSLRPGVQPVVSSFQVTEDDAKDLIGRATSGNGGPPTATLRISSDAGESQFDDLTVLHIAGGDAPGLARVVVADRRWKWPYKYFRRSMNIRRKVGVQRLVTPDALETWPIGPELQYAPWSLIGGNIPWDAKRLLEALSAALADLDGTNAIIRARGIADVPIQDLELDGSLDQVIQRALGYLPGVGVTVRENGDVVFYDTADESEGKTFDTIGAPLVGSVIPPDVDYSRIRPRIIRVLFTPEIELRFDFEDAGAGGTSSRGRDDRYMENVLPLPDYSTEVDGNSLPRGTWTEFTSAMTAWGNLPVIGTPMSNRILRLAMVPQNDIWAGTELAGLSDPDADWVGRIGTAQQHFRRTFRVNRRWMDRIQSIRAYRVATIDPTTGQRGPATVLTDYSYLYTMRSLLVESNKGGPLSFVLNVAGYPSGGTISASTPGTSATATILDPDQGIIGIDFLSDRNRVYEMALPSQVERDGANTTPGTRVAADSASPSPRMSDRTKPITFDSVNEAGAKGYALADRHKLSVIVTAVPATPNDTAGLVAIDVRPSDAGFNGDCVGPIMEVRILPSIETARIAWKDGEAQRITDLFTRTSVEGQSLAKDLAGLLVNYGGDSDEAQNGASLRGLAVASAARIWQSMRDRVVGSLTTGHASGFRISGLLADLTTDLAADGTVTVTASVPERAVPLDLARYLDASTLRIVRRTLPQR